jgi:hypothetical protein
MLTAYQWLCLAGVPSIIGGITGWAIAKLRMNKTQDKALRCSVQALLRHLLRDMYETHKKMEYASFDAKDDFQNLYKWYETLGENGVMEETYKQFMAFPTEPVEIQNGSTL